MEAIVVWSILLKPTVAEEGYLARSQQLDCGVWGQERWLTAHISLLLHLLTTKDAEAGTVPHEPLHGKEADISLLKARRQARAVTTDHLTPLGASRRHTANTALRVRRLLALGIEHLSRIARCA
eukprot:4152995-Prymnesium_polylepis.3